MFENRHNEILQLLNKNGYMEVNELADQLNVSNVTIRRDLQLLEKQGKCVRKHGGVMTRGLTLEIPYEQKMLTATKEKQAIAQLAIDLVEDGDALILDAGSTVFELACLLNQKKDLTVVTNDLKTAIILASSQDIKLYVPAGRVTPQVYSISSGTDTLMYFNDIHVNKVFLGADAIPPSGVITNVNVNETYLKQAMIKAGSKLIVLADSRKFANQYFMTVCDCSQVDVLITDSGVKPESVEMLKNYDVDVRIAQIDANK